MAFIAFSKGAAVQYLSASQGGYIDTVVEDVLASGEVIVSCRPGYCISLSEQKARLRPRAKSSADAASLASAGLQAPSPTAIALSHAAVSDAAKQAGAGYKLGSICEVNWFTDHTISLGPHCPEDLKWARFLDKNLVSSAHTAVDMLNSGSLECPEDFCVVYSLSSRSYFLLYRRGCREKALSKCMDQLRMELASRNKPQGNFSSINMSSIRMMSGHEKMVETLEKKCKEEREQRHAAEEDLRQTQLAKVELQRGLSDAQNQLVQTTCKAGVNVGLEKQLQELSQARTSLQEELTKAEGKLAAVAAAESNRRGLEQQLLQQYKEASALNGQLQEEISTAQGEIRSLQEKLDSEHVLLRSNLASEQSHREELERRCASLQKEFDLSKSSRPREDDGDLRNALEREVERAASLDRVLARTRELQKTATREADDRLRAMSVSRDALQRQLAAVEDDLRAKDELEAEVQVLGSALKNTMRVDERSTLLAAALREEIERRAHLQRTCDRHESQAYYLEELLRETVATTQELHRQYVHLESIANQAGVQRAAYAFY